jgi:hypothetical protein
MIMPAIQAKTLDSIPPDDLITPREAARIFHVEPRTIANYRDAGLLEFVSINRRKFLYRRSQIALLISSRRVPATAQPELNFFSR